MNVGAVLANEIERTREWTLKLLEDISGSEWTFQPAAGLQHALWLCGHMACAQELLLFQRCLGQSALDPEFAGHFQIDAAVQSAEARNWPSPEVVRTHMDHMQKMTVETVRALADDVLEEPAFGKDGATHPHYANKREAVGHLVRHEAFHSGQLATIRRLLGKPFLR